MVENLYALPSTLFIVVAFPSDQFGKCRFRISSHVIAASPLRPDDTVLKKYTQLENTKCDFRNTDMDSREKNTAIQLYRSYFLRFVAFAD